jgi:hypothetical protein
VSPLHRVTASTFCSQPVHRNCGMQRPVRVLESDSSTRGRRIPVRGLQGREINSRHSPSPAADPSATGQFKKKRYYSLLVPYFNEFNECTTTYQSKNNALMYKIQDAFGVLAQVFLNLVVPSKQVANRPKIHTKCLLKNQ